MRKPTPASQIDTWRTAHPLEAVWNIAIGTNRGRLHHRLQAQRELRHVMHQRYMDYGRRGKGNKANRRAKALYTRSWPAVLACVSTTPHQKEDSMAKIKVRCACGVEAKITEIRSNLSVALGFPPVRYVCDVCWRKEQPAKGQVPPWKESRGSTVIDEGEGMAL